MARARLLIVICMDAVVMSTVIIELYVQNAWSELINAGTRKVTNV